MARFASWLVAAGFIVALVAIGCDDGSVVQNQVQADAVQLPAGTEFTEYQLRDGDPRNHLQVLKYKDKIHVFYLHTSRGNTGMSESMIKVGEYNAE